MARSREFLLQVRFEPARLAKDTLRVAYEMILPVHRLCLRSPAAKPRDAPPAEGTTCEEQAS